MKTRLTLDPVLRGPLQEGCFPPLLRALYVGRRTGLLHVTHGADRGGVLFIGGHIVYGDTTMAECQLGPTMVRHGLLEQVMLEVAAPQVTPRRRLGQVLLEMGAIDEERLQDALAIHAREVLMSIFSWREGSYEFEEREAEQFQGYDRALRLSTGEVILDAVWSVSDPDVLRYALGDIDQPLAPSTDPLLRFQKITLTPTDGYILSRVDRALTAREILEIAPVGPEEALRSLLGLLCTGMIEYVRAERPSEPELSGTRLRERVIEVHRSLPARDHFEVLGVSRGASESDVKSAFLQLARTFHPDAQHDPALADLRDMLNAIFERLSEAHRVLGDSASRAAYEKGLRGKVEQPAPSPLHPAPASVPPPAVAASAPSTPAPPAGVGRYEDAMRAAEAAFGEGRYWEVIAPLVDLVPELQGRQQGRARLQIARAYLRMGDRTKEAEQELLALVRADPGDAEAHYLLGTIYRDRGLPARAMGMFRKTLELKPRHLDAKAALATLGEPPEPKGGLLKKLLR